MAITVTQRPSKTKTISVGGSPGSYISKWNAVHNPIIYKFARIDLSGSISTPSGSDLEVVIAGTDATPLIQAGDTIYLRDTVNTTPLYDGEYLVDSIVYSAPDTTITIITPYLGASATVVVNNITRQPNHKLEVALYASLVSDPDSYELVSTSKYSPKRDWTFNVDVSEMLRGVLQKCEDEMLYNTAVNNFDDTRNSCYFWIEYRDTWTDSANAYTSDISNPAISRYLDIHCYFATKSVRQLGTVNGSNLFEYICFGFPQVPTATFISDFYEPVYFFGYPFDLSFICSEDFAQEADPIYIEIKGLDINRQHVDTANLLYLNIADYAIWNRALLTYVSAWAGTPIRYYSVSIKTVSQKLIESLIIKVEEYCASNNNEVLLKWKGPSGAWNYWLFENNQDYIQESQATGTFEPVLTDLETDQSNIDFISKDSQNSIRLGAHGIIAANWDGMKSLASSPKVYMLTGGDYTQAAPGYTWQTVRVRNNSLTRKSKLSTFDVDFIIDLPKTYNVTN